MLNDRITSLKKELIEYATLVESMIEKGIKGLVNKDKDVLTEIIEENETKANNFELELDEICTTLIAQYEPRARDLRTILMVLKMNNDLERMADHAVNIAESALYLIERPVIKPYMDIPRMGEITTTMLRNSIDSFINENAELARQVCETDIDVDNLRSQIMRELITYMTSDNTTIERALHLLRISSNLERIADLSTNICEDIVFMVKGKIIKHHKDEI
ncbi:MAG: phosphate transport system regulatory protein PhoU [Candidatus Margulisiibacteriota bacterium]|nr:MAG: phosphate transport system regulatory protein PhoU [Candidatus Margulisbacteria bacterium GWD2_39_127]OGI05157.1 MAG: phosphate transport system regulatory protein PhoU [Candidatus Margulisbacteria bacterium GWF2_38_17]OGI06206.1 MAG: phosphate transport system regulatory protein PhoU [Candidatus Margulisbacteria bacterium GWE2_39_32]PZM78861.1 MAG: phosphate transport system regulatory protein PhoU [Candidatus Margulisiibacteriota bacterium]HAR64559.1 phosphate transport system regulat